MQKYIISIFTLISIITTAQQNKLKWPDKGIKLYSNDSIYSVNLKFRMQNRAIYTTVSENDFSAQEIEARVRRLRLTLDGFLYNKKLTYKIQLSFSRGDMDWNVTDNSSNNNSPNIVRDAIINYQVTKKINIGFGQTKLPGNRQRVISSGAQQFVDRSIVNATFNIDRDFGLFLTYKNQIGLLNYNIKSALSSGEGRNSNISLMDGLAYTGRIELLPLGEFTNGGDYFEGDLERETKPKISIAGSYSYNSKALRESGQLGRDLYEARNIEFIESDIMIKYRGFAFETEYLKRKTNNPLTTNSLNQERIIYEGDGVCSQLSYIFKNNLEVAGRYAFIKPSERLRFKKDFINSYTLGITKYIVQHKLKIQSNIAYQEVKNYKANDTFFAKNNWFFMFQLEIGI